VGKGGIELCFGWKKRESHHLKKSRHGNKEFVSRGGKLIRSRRRLNPEEKKKVLGNDRRRGTYSKFNGKAESGLVLKGEGGSWGSGERMG